MRNDDEDNMDVLSPVLRQFTGISVKNGRPALQALFSIDVSSAFTRSQTTRTHTVFLCSHFDFHAGVGQAMMNLIPSCTCLHP